MIKIATYLFLLFGVILVTNQTSFAQSDTSTVHQIKGKSYYIHIVEKGNTLYSIQQLYHVPQDIIKKENPSVLDGLSIGEKIYIPVNKNKEETTSVNGNFITHKVKRGQTIYSIAKEYGVQQKDITIANPELVDGMKKGQLIKIPVQKIKQTTSALEEGEEVYKTHLIKKGETLYSLSKFYNVLVDSIKIVNDGLSGGLREGVTIFIPIKQIIITDTSSVETLLQPFHLTDSLLLDTIVKKEEYEIALLLPFYLEENDRLERDREPTDKKNIYSKSKFAIEFYNGFLMSLDSISNDSTKFKLFVYDTRGRDSITVASILLKEELKKVDLIVGPLYGSNFRQAAQFAKQNRIPIVSPVKQNNKVLLGNPFVFKPIPSMSTIVDDVVTLVIDSFKNDNLLAIACKEAKEKILIDLYVKQYNNRILGATDDTLIYSSIKTLYTSSRRIKMDSILAMLSVEKHNVIFVPSTDQIFITNLLNQLISVLNQEDAPDYQVTLVGLEEWLRYENIDLDYFQELNVYLPVSEYIDYNDYKIKQLTQEYMNRFETYPSKIAFSGFDLAYYFGTSLAKDGTVFKHSEEFQGNSINLDFFKTGIESGYENQHTFMLRFNNYTLERIDK